MKKICKIIPLAIAIVLTNILSLSTHALILREFPAPVLNIGQELNYIMGIFLRFLIVTGAMLIYFLSCTFWERLKLHNRVILFTLLILALTEQLFRTPIMEVVTGVPWTYQAISTIPSWITWFMFSLLVCLFMSVQRKSKFIVFQYIVFSILATIAILFIKKWAHALIAPLLSMVPQIEMFELVQPPYGMKVMIASCITFLEPTVAVFILFYLVRNTLSGFNTSLKGLIVGGILILIHGGIYSMVQIVCSEGNIPYRIFYYGQFLWEYLALGILTAYSVEFIDGRGRIFVRKN